MYIRLKNHKTERLENIVKICLIYDESFVAYTTPSKFLKIAVKT